MISKALGSYARKSPAGILAQQAPDRPRNDLAALAGVRLMSVSETSTHLMVDEALVKTMTGNDLISARFLNKEFFQFRPEFTALLDTNHLPRFKEVGTAMTRRVRVVPWSVTIPDDQVDECLDDRLRAELPGILAWIVQGAIRYLAVGISEPASVLKASRGHMAECDPLGRWLEDRTVTDVAARTKALALYADYQRWAAAEKEPAIHMKEFKKRLEERGWDSLKTGGNICWKGHRLRDHGGHDSHHSTEAETQDASRSPEYTDDASETLHDVNCPCQPTPGGNYLA